MTIYRPVFIYCDGEECRNIHEPFSPTDGDHGLSRKAQWKQARMAGWMAWGLLHLCPKCALAMKKGGDPEKEDKP